MNTNKRRKASKILVGIAGVATVIAILTGSWKAAQFVFASLLLSFSLMLEMIQNGTFASDERQSKLNEYR